MAQDLPDGYQLAYIYEMSESLNESSGSNTFVFEYINVNNRERPLSEQSRLFIWQGVDPHPNLDNKNAVDTITLNTDEICLYPSDTGSTLRAFFIVDQVNAELEYLNTPKEDIERIALSLAVN